MTDKHPGGRPTDYCPEIVETARSYIDNYNTEYGHSLPSVVGLAKVLKKHRDTLYEWAKHEDKQEFSDILRIIDNNQQFDLVEGGLTNKFNSTITKLMLGQHGITDKQETELTADVKTTDTSAIDAVKQLIETQSTK